MLKKGMYPARGTPGRFGLRSAQLRPRNDTAIRNASWYNGAGEKLGWGDLSFDDLKRVAAGLRRNEVFIILDQRTSYFAFLYPESHAWAMPNGRPNAPGRAFVARHARFAILPGRLCVIDHGYVVPRGRARRGFSWLTEAELRKMLPRRRP